MLYTEDHKDFNISRICFGGASVSGEGAGYGFGNISKNESIKLIEESFEVGINIFDTAPIYGFGESEKRIGLALKAKRDKVHIISKSGVSWHDNRRVDMTNDPVIAKKQLEQSLRRLNCDYIDTYMVHWPDTRVDLRSTLEVYTKAKEKGLIKNIGLCNSSPSEIKKAKKVCDLSFIQSEVNLFNDQISNLIPLSDALTMSWGTFDKGIITGRVSLDRKFDKSDCRSWAPWWKKSNWKEKVLKIEKLKCFAQSHEIDLVSFALGHNLNIVNSAICGFKNSEQLNSIIKCLDNLPNEKIILNGLKYAKIH